MVRCGAALSLLLLVLGACCAWPAGGAHLSALGRTLVVEASPKAGRVMLACEDAITVTWYLNASSSSDSDVRYKAVEVSQCYVTVSQKEHRWRKANKDLSNDKACQFKIAQQSYAGASTGPTTFKYRVIRDVATASYHVRAYTRDAYGEQDGYGQTVPACFDVTGITCIHMLIEIATGVFSVFFVACARLLPRR